MNILVMFSAIGIHNFPTVRVGYTESRKKSSLSIICANYNDQPAEVTLNCGLVRKSLQNPLNSGLRY